MFESLLGAAPGIAGAFSDPAAPDFSTNNMLSGMGGFDIGAFLPGGWTFDNDKVIGGSGSLDNTNNPSAGSPSATPSATAAMGINGPIILAAGLLAAALIFSRK